MKNSIKKRKLVIFEGVDKVGKTTLLNSYVAQRNWQHKDHNNFLLHKEPDFAGLSLIKTYMNKTTVLKPFELQLLLSFCRVFSEDFLSLYSTTDTTDEYNPLIFLDRSCLSGYIYLLAGLRDDPLLDMYRMLYLEINKRISEKFSDLFDIYLVIVKTDHPLVQLDESSYEKTIVNDWYHIRDAYCDVVENKLPILQRLFATKNIKTLIVDNTEKNKQNLYGILECFIFD